MIPKKLYLLFFILLVIFTQSCKKELPVIPEKKSDLVEIKRLIALGDDYFESSKYDSSYYYFDKAKLACDPKKHPKQYVYAISNLATIQQNQGDFSGSETTAMEAMPILETTTNPNCKWSIYTILGINYLNTFDYYYALYYFNSALDLKTDGYRHNGALNNIALTYMEQEEYQKALTILLPMTLDNKVKNDPTENSRIINNIGHCYFKTGNPKSLDFLTKSLKIRTQLKNNWTLVTSFYNLSLFYKKNSPNLSRKYAQLSYDKSTILNNVDIRLESLKLLIRNSSGTSLKKYSLNYIHINDSITKVRQQAKNQFAKMKYDSKKGNDEILQLKAQKDENALELQLQKNTTLNLYFIVGLLLTITGFIYSYLVEKSKRGKIKTSYDTEVRIAKKLHDELANDVYQTMAFVETQDLSSSHNKEILLDNLDTIYSRTRNISK
jgi:tetratricopeptide (TPR) repeat protein